MSRAILTRPRSRALRLFCGLLTAGVTSAVMADCTPQFTMVNEPGFGDRFNIYAWSMQVFNDRLYVSTLNEKHGGEIWRYDGTSWEKVIEHGFGNPENHGIRNLIIYQGALYAGTINDTQGAQIWRSTDGTQWSQVMQGGFGNPGNEAVRGMIEFRKQLYAGVQTSDLSAAELWRSTDGNLWNPVSTTGFGYPGNSSFHTMEIFPNQYMYVGTRNTYTGTQLWRTFDGNTYQKVIGPNGKGGPSGFGNPANGVTFHLKKFQNQLYAGTGNVNPDTPEERESRPAASGEVHGFGVYRSADGLTFEQIGEPGFGDPDNGYAWRFYEYQNQLWLGVTNTNILVKGGGVWRSPDGKNWTELVGANGVYMGYGFNNTKNWGTRSFAEYRGKLYIGTAQCWFDECDAFVTGTEVWEWPGDVCPAQSQ